ncbi:MAG: tRNA (adenosine(37)-N6)-threonylcarbamoyltransferase complex dimerization subunit type 1 TsaB [Bacteroidales bacterium]|nr:tRNA (adenosine(37)-N6)-threonylcarbamoyltransferase complex dimerization subunit type 1 TsaB [Bacteroidales bacterium]
MTILLLETATQVCSVAMFRDGVVLAYVRSDEPNAHSSKLAVFINEVVERSSLKIKDIDAVCVSSGPGSYTGLRIGVSSAKGLCYALGVPLLSVPTLQNMANLYFLQNPDYDGLVCPMIDARRMECYTALFCREKQVRDTAAEVVEPGIYDSFLDRGLVTFIGDGAEKTKPILEQHPNARYADDFQIDACGMATIAMKKLEKGEVEDVAYFEPYYLKDFVAKKSVVHGLR